MFLLNKNLNNQGTCRILWHFHFHRARAQDCPEHLVPVYSNQMVKGPQNLATILIVKNHPWAEALLSEEGNTLLFKGYTVAHKDIEPHRLSPLDEQLLTNCTRERRGHWVLADTTFNTASPKADCGNNVSNSSTKYHPWENNVGKALTTPL